MDLVTGGLGKLAPKLLQLLGDEYKLQKGVRKQVEFVLQELESNHSALRKVAQVPWEQLDDQVKVWACQVRETSYDMDDILDKFLVRVEGREPGPGKEDWVKDTMKTMSDLFGKLKDRHKIAGAINEIQKKLEVVAQRRDRSRVDMLLAKPAATSVDPRLLAMHTEVTQLIGIAKSSSELISMLSLQDDVIGKTKIVSVVGVGGLGKTTLAKAVYDQLKPCFECGAFVPVGRNADLKKVFRDVLIDLDKEYMNVKYDILDVRQLINELCDLLGSKRYFIVIDDVWDARTWNAIKSAFDQKNSGSRVITTTRKREVTSSGEEVYQLGTLSYENSKKLFCTRLFQAEFPEEADHPEEAFEKILKKCGGVPLAIITMASLLVGKSREDWFDICSSPGFSGGRVNQQLDDTDWILSLSYYDLPPSLKACLLYLSVYPEDYYIEKRSLIWMWIAEGFIERQPGKSLFQMGEECFHELINRSLIQIQECHRLGYCICYCRVHDMVLDLIRGLSDKENFVTIVSDCNADQGTSPSSSGNKVRRLAHQKRMMKQVTEQDGHSSVRSFVAYECDIQSWVLPRFEVLRVLALEGCSVPPAGWQGLKHIGKLLHLRYLGLRTIVGNRSFEVPESIGNLKFLQTLDLDYFCTGVLPLGVCEMTQMVCLHGGQYVEAPDGLLTKMKLLEELQIRIDRLNDESKLQFVKDIGNQTEARVVHIIGKLKEVHLTELVQSLGKLHKLRHLELEDHTDSGWVMGSGEWDTLLLPRDLQQLTFNGPAAISFHQVPLSINPAHLPRLYKLSLPVEHLDEAGLRALGGLPELRFLHLETRRWPMASGSSAQVNITAGDGLFKQLRCLLLTGYTFHLVVNNNEDVSLRCWDGGAMGSRTDQSDEHIAPAVAVMPYLHTLRFYVPVKALYKDGSGSRCDNLGLQYLPSLQRVYAILNCEDAPEGDVEKAEAALMQAEKLLPNTRIGMRRIGQ